MLVSSKSNYHIITSTTAPAAARQWTVQHSEKCFFQPIYADCVYLEKKNNCKIFWSETWAEHEFFGWPTLKTWWDITHSYYIILNGKTVNWNVSKWNLAVTLITRWAITGSSEPLVFSSSCKFVENYFHISDDCLKNLWIVQIGNFWRLITTK